MRTFKVYAIKNGTVIDHIPEGKGVEIIDLLRLRQWRKIVTVGIGFSSKKYGKKDIVKIENKELTAEEANKIAIIAPTATLNIIRNFERVSKQNVKLPEVIEGILKCPNPACITNHEPVTTKFFHDETGELHMRCWYCERYFKATDVEVM
ncbi:MAG: aspartate carbamoyltransferase regulatory subunit [Patescibacteria group bacterium]|nr:aspartate carbamoyltransferase regulatory subunit [Patescibacteria group bacterium]MDD5715541.1 aspartate carbamoyltransferase regulatory subunit [Patescibacteria group bacterium]